MLSIVRRDQQRLVPIAVEQRRKRMRLVMVVENDFGVVAKAAGAPEFVDLEDIVNIPGVISQKLLWHVTAGAPLDVFAIFFPYPARAADVSIKNRREFTAAETGDVDVLARFPGIAKTSSMARSGWSRPSHLKRVSRSS
jgi:hypothetical protein